MVTKTSECFEQASHLIDVEAHVLANTASYEQMSSKDIYKIVEQIERARNLLLVVGDRLSVRDQYQAETKSANKEVTF